MRQMIIRCVGQEEQWGGKEIDTNNTDTHTIKGRERKKET